MPEPAPRRPGHPSFQPNQRQRQAVQMLRASGNALPIIAANVGCDVKTLKKHFKVELADGHAQVVAAALPSSRSRFGAT